MFWVEALESATELSWSLRLTNSLEESVHISAWRSGWIGTVKSLDENELDIDAYLTGDSKGWMVLEKEGVGMSSGVWGLIAFPWRKARWLPSEDPLHNESQARKWHTSEIHFTRGLWHGTSLWRLGWSALVKQPRPSPAFRMLPWYLFNKRNGRPQKD